MYIYFLLMLSSRAELYYMQFLSDHFFVIVRHRNMDLRSPWGAAGTSIVSPFPKGPATDLCEKDFISCPSRLFHNLESIELKFAVSFQDTVYTASYLHLVSVSLLTALTNLTCINRGKI